MVRTLLDQEFLGLGTVHDAKNKLKKNLSNGLRAIIRVDRWLTKKTNSNETFILYYDCMSTLPVPFILHKVTKKNNHKNTDFSPTHKL